MFTKTYLLKNANNYGNIIIADTAIAVYRWGYSSAGRALEWHSRGQRFDPAYLHQEIQAFAGSTAKAFVLHVATERMKRESLFIGLSLLTFSWAFLQPGHGCGSGSCWATALPSEMNYRYFTCFNVILAGFVKPAIVAILTMDQ